ncbi:MAG: hypothetical protein H0V70_00180 [Ktedonobacteraceae bacterium]|nr:hypothetical protein [Ktedonobacteraceae bacterium]
MFKPLRFNELLKAVPGLAHLQLTPQAAHHAKSQTYVRVREQIEVDSKRSPNHGGKEGHVHERIKEDITIERQKGKKVTQVHGQIVKDIDVTRKAGHDEVTETTTLQHVHATVFGIAEVEMTPPHPPREDTPLYMRTHHRLVITLDTPCAICGVRHSTLSNPRENPFHAQAIETHHYPVERSLLNACDPRKLGVVFPQVKDRKSMEAFIDSEENLMVLCDIHHRHPHYGIHHILAQDFFVQPFLFNGYQVVADLEDAKKVMVANERVIRSHQSKK